MKISTYSAPTFKEALNKAIAELDESRCRVIAVTGSIRASRVLCDLSVVTETRTETLRPLFLQDSTCYGSHPGTEPAKPDVSKRIEFI